jgi:hemolysin D
VKLKPKRLTIRVKDKDVPLAPGMAVTAEIKTGERRVIGFFIVDYSHCDPLTALTAISG